MLACHQISIKHVMYVGSQSCFLKENSCVCVTRPQGITQVVLGIIPLAHDCIPSAMQDETGTQQTGGVGAWDEEDERQLWLLHLEQSAVTALDAQRVLQQELMLLQHVLQSRSQEQQGQMPETSSSRGSTSQPRGAGRGQDAAAGDAAAKAAMAARLRDISQHLAVNDRQRAMQQVRRCSLSLVCLRCTGQNHLTDGAWPSLVVYTYVMVVCMWWEIV
jgi:hypothetical protein